MIGKKGGVATYLKQIQPSLIVHCLAHRLELAYKDAVKKIPVYSYLLVLLVGIYYFYHYRDVHSQSPARYGESI